MTRSGRFVASRAPTGLAIHDVLGPNPPRRIAAMVGDTLAVTEAHCWWLGPERWLWRAALRIAAVPELVIGERLTSLISTGDRGLIAEANDETWFIDATSGLVTGRLDELGARALAVYGRHVVSTTKHELRVHSGAKPPVRIPAVGGVALAASFVLGDRAIAAWVRGQDGDALAVYSVAGKLVHRIAAPPLERCVFAATANLAIAKTATDVVAFDLRYGRVYASVATGALADLDVDHNARQIVVARDGASGLDVRHLTFEELFTPSPAEPAAPAIELTEPTSEQPPDQLASEEPSAPLDVDALPYPRALAAERRPFELSSPAEHELAPFPTHHEHLTALLGVVSARAALAIAESWHSGRCSRDADGDLPYEREVLGIVGDDVGLAADAVVRARQRLRTRSEAMIRRTEASLARGMTLPFCELARELSLSPVATQILACAVAPRLTGGVGRLYGVLAGVEGASPCSQHLLDALVETRDPCAIAAELVADATLIRSGLVTLQGARGELEVDDVLLDRLRGLHRRIELGAASTRRGATIDLGAVIAPDGVKRTLAEGLAEASSEHPVRVVVRGRPGHGRHTLIAAFAKQVGRDLAAIDAAGLPSGAQLPAALARELARARIAECIPVVSGLEIRDPSESTHQHALEAVIRRHPGPVVIRTSPDSNVPVGADRIEITLPPLGIGQRSEAWQRALERRGFAQLDSADAIRLATTYRFGPGTIERVCELAARRARRSSDPLSELLHTLAGQHIAGKLERVAHRVTRLADWDQVTLVDDMRDSVREFIGRMRHQRTVYEDWGLDRRIATARGLTALFYGPPGTGKTLVAGLIGRELGLEVWRIDLAKVVSKWVGETEKSLAEIFDAAEEGQVMLLFDEADSLFGKRSEVKSSNDRYANLEVNYLLQRLDSFEGVAILTTNLDGSIDPAFKRRLSMRLYFAFPDEELRAQLWAAHVPPGVPRTGTLDFSDLARRFPMSGGYIRNSALRAAFLAAQEGCALSQGHLLRAVQLEYRELGKLSTSGRMD